jgi:tRNA dimethylallyltransferase
VVSRDPLLVLVGPTGVGKTAVAVRLAGRVGLEAVNADSRQVYRGMDVGTGKPTAAERAALPHHLLDVVEPHERYHAARFAAEARAAIAAIRDRGRLPIVVGGTGLYVRALLKGLRPGPPADPALRAELEAVARREGPAALHARLRAVDAAAAARLHPNDRVRIVRAIETRARAPVGAAAPDGEGDWAAAPAGWRVCMVGLHQDRARLNRRLADRVRDMVARGMLDEVARLLARGVAESAPGMAGIGYRHFCAVVRGTLAAAEAERLMLRDTTRYAKRQMTWFARDVEVHWLDVDAAGGIEGAAERVLRRAREEGLIG